MYGGAAAVRSARSRPGTPYQVSLGEPSVQEVKTLALVT